MTTIKDIAARAGVTPTTVSNVLHNRTERVSAETVRRVREIIQETGYVPNMSARSLVGSSSRIIAVISSLVPLSCGGFFQDSFHSVLLSGIEQAVRREGYFLMVRTVEDAGELQSLLTNWNIDGLIMTGLFPDSLYQELTQLGKPFVQIDSQGSTDSLRVLLQDEQGGYLAARYLLEMGHRDILFCCPPRSKSPVVVDRYRGFLRAMREKGIDFPEERVVESEFANTEGIETGKLLAKRDDFTAVFATADTLACQLCTGLMLGGRRIPEEISVVGFDDTAVSRMNCPPLTTVHQDIAGRGEKAVEMLVRAIRTGENAPPYMFPVHLIERDSVRRIG